MSGYANATPEVRKALDDFLAAFDAFERSRDQLESGVRDKCFDALSAIGDPGVVAEHIGELVAAAERAATVVEKNVWHQREKAEDAVPILRKALAKLKGEPHDKTDE